VVCCTGLGFDSACDKAEGRVASLWSRAARQPRCHGYKAKCRERSPDGT
jgi:hypothetical protein